MLSMVFDMARDSDPTAATLSRDILVTLRRTFCIFDIPIRMSLCYVYDNVPLLYLIMSPVNYCRAKADALKRTKKS